MKRFAIALLFLLCVSPSLSAEDKTAIVLPPTTPCEAGTGTNPDAVSECIKRETARLFMALGELDAARRVLCSSVIVTRGAYKSQDECLAQTGKKAENK